VLVSLLGTIQDNTKMADPFFPFLATERQSFFSIEPLYAFVIDQMAFPMKEHQKPGRAEFPPLLSQFSQPDT